MARVVYCLLIFFVAAGCQGAAQTNSDSQLDPDLPVPGESFGESCYRCHGNSLSPAPPRGIGGQMEPTDMGVGAHRSHLAVTEKSTWHAPVLCSSCHVVPEEDNSPGHIDDDDLRAEVIFSGIAIAEGSSPLRNDDGTCSGVYCHGATLTGGTTPQPMWNVVDGSQRECGSCHGAPPPAPHPEGDSCGSCHPNMEAGSNTFLDPSTHINGVVELSNGAGGACDSCHGSDGISAPPNDLEGNVARTFAGVGAHRQHLGTSSWRREINCSNCHRVPADFSDPAHIDGDDAAEVPFDVLNPLGIYSRATAGCDNLYCHGNGRANNGSLDWTSLVAMDCESCHQTPSVGQPANGMSGAHDKHIRDKRVPCVDCHAEVVDAGTNIIAAQLHVNGLREIRMPSGGDWDPGTRSCTNLACHEPEGWNGGD